MCSSFEWHNVILKEGRCVFLFRFSFSFVSIQNACTRFAAKRSAQLEKSFAGDMHILNSYWRHDNRSVVNIEYMKHYLWSVLESR